MQLDVGWNALGTKGLDTGVGPAYIRDHVLLHICYVTGWDGHWVFVKPGATDALIWEKWLEIWLRPKGGSLDCENWDTLDSYIDLNIISPSCNINIIMTHRNEDEQALARLPPKKKLIKKDRRDRDHRSFKLIWTRIEPLLPIKNILILPGDCIIPLNSISMFSLIEELYTKNSSVKN